MSGLNLSLSNSITLHSTLQVYTNLCINGFFINLYINLYI